MKKHINIMFLFIFFINIATLSTAACDNNATQMSIGRPAAFALLDGYNIRGELKAFREQEGQNDPCSGKLVKKADMDEGPAGYTGNLDLAPGSYKVCAAFYLAGENILISRYQDIPVLIVKGEETLVYRTTEYFVDRDDKTPSDFDFDDDGIFNLDELLFGLNIRQSDPAERPEDVELEAPASGTFYIGSDANDALFEERPGATRTVGHFWIDKFEVNQRAYARCVARNNCPLPINADKLSFASALGLSATNQEDDAGLDVLNDPGFLPITSVSQGAAASFCLMHGGRLPKEEEWEYAAIPNGGPYPWSGDVSMESIFASPSQCEEINARYPGVLNGEPAQACNDLQQDSHGDPVSTLAYGFAETHQLGCSSTPGHDNDHKGPCQMAGNVWEWTSSVFAPYSESPVESPDSLYTIRGGSADSLSLFLRSSYRFGAKPNLEDQQSLAPLIGFRCVYDNEAP